MRRARASLIASVVIGLLAVTTAGVSTYAWYQVNSDAVVATQNTSTTITAAKPDEYAFYAYRYNASSSYGTVTNHGASTSDFETDFTTITSSNVSTLTSLSGLNPGQSMVYCIKVTGATVGNPISLNIHTLISNTAIKQGITYNNGVSDVEQHRYYVTAENQNTGTEINVGWAIDIYSMSSTDGTGYESFLTSSGLADKFNYSKSSLGELNNAGTGSAPNKIVTLGSDIEIYNQNAAATTVYVFYRVYYSDAATTFFKEINVKGYNVEETSDNRRFLYVGDSTGTSNCYGGLKFQLNNMILAF